MSNHVGIDYGKGKTNIDTETGIRFGVISQHSVMGEALDDVEYDYGEATCFQCGNKAEDSDEAPEEVEEKAWFRGQDYYCVACERSFWSDQAFNDESYGFSYDKDGYKLVGCLDSDIMVLKSNFYTFAQFCSPCVPGACNLDNSMPEGAKCYCLNHDWFEGGNAPYPVYKVKDNAQVLPDIVLSEGAPDEVQTGSDTQS